MNERVEKLLNSSLAARNFGALKPGQTKLGIDYDALVIGDGVIEAKLDLPGQQGFRITPDGTKLNTGPRLETECDYKSLRFDNNKERLNPLADTRASNTADPIPTVVQTIPDDLLWALGPNFQQALSLLGSI